MHRDQEVDRVVEAIRRIRGEVGIETCASLGCLSAEDLARLKAAGLGRFHHNLETAPSHFSEICSTHAFAERVDTARRVRDSGLALCCGGIFGLGETPGQRVEMLLDQYSLNYEVEWSLSGEPFLTRGGELLDATAEAIEAVAGYRPDINTAGGTSDGRFIAPTGAQVLELGPLNATIHKVNECVSIADLDTLSNIYQRILERLLLK